MQLQCILFTALVFVVHGTTRPPCDCSHYAHYNTPGGSLPGYRTYATHCEVWYGSDRWIQCHPVVGDFWKKIAKKQVHSCRLTNGNYNGCCNRECRAGTGPDPNTKAPTIAPTFTPTNSPTLAPVQYVVPKTCSSSRGDCARSIDGNSGSMSWMTRSGACNSEVMSWSVTDAVRISGIKLRTTHHLGSAGSRTCLKFRVSVDGDRVHIRSGTINSVAQAVQPSGSTWDFNGFSPRDSLSEIKWSPIQGKRVEITFANCHHACHTHWPISTLRFLTGAAAQAEGEKCGVEFISPTDGVIQHGDCQDGLECIGDDDSGGYAAGRCTKITTTKSPTSNPSKNPTSSPTRNPTKTPTSSPTRNPTKTPTSSPTRNPTKTPTSYPSRTPTSNPTTSPSENPSMAPTMSPSPFPTAKEFVMKIKGFHGSPEASIARIVLAQDKAEVEKINFDVQSIKTTKVSAKKI